MQVRKTTWIGPGFFGAAGLAALALFVCFAPTAAAARKPIISYIDAGGRFALYDSETSTDLPAPPVSVPPGGAAQFRWGMSSSGRFIVSTDAGKKLHLLDRTSNKEVPVPGIDVYANPGSLSASNTGLIAFDDNGNGPARVYDSTKKAFIDTGLASTNGHRQTQLSGDGHYLATTCLSNCVVDRGGDSSAYVQDLLTKKDTGFPDNLSGADNRDEEHPCIDQEGRFVGLDVPNPTTRDTLLYDRFANAPVPLPGLNGALDDTHCIMGFAGAYIGVANPTFRVYQRSTGTGVPLLPRGFDQRSTFSAPLPPSDCVPVTYDFYGTAGNDNIAGTREPDQVDLFTGDDAVNARSGSDCIFGREGNDRLSGQNGNDYIEAGPGDDKVVGGSDNDRIIGKAGKDRINANSGDDNVTGGDDADRISGGNGNDRLHAGNGDDKVVGGSDNDRIIGKAGNDSINANSGVDDVTGGAGNDRISGGNGNDVRLHGGAGNDKISGNFGDDAIFGKDGNDRLFGDAGRDLISGGSGDDQIFAIDGTRDEVRCGSGRDTVKADAQDSVSGDCERVDVAR